MEIVRPCPQCQHRGSLQGNSRLGKLRCTVCGFARVATAAEVKPPERRRPDEEERARV